MLTIFLLLFPAETPNEHKNWLNAIKSMSLLAVKKVDEFPFAVLSTKEAADAPKSTLIVKRSEGFTLKDSKGVFIPSPLSLLLFVFLC